MESLAPDSQMQCNFDIGDVLCADSSRRFEQRHSGRTVAMDVTFEDEPEETLPDDMAVGDTHDILKTFRMPHGSVVCDLFAGN